MRCGSMRCIWCCGSIIALCLLIGIPLLAHGGANIPYSLTRQESASNPSNQAQVLEEKQRASSAWKELIVGAGFSFTGIGLGFLMFCYCVGFWGRVHPELDYPPRLRRPSGSDPHQVDSLQSVTVDR